MGVRFAGWVCGIPSVPIAVKAQEERGEGAGGRSSTIPGYNNKLARPTGFTPSVAAAVKAEATRKRGATHASNVSSELESEVDAEAGVADFIKNLSS
eukprot:g5758.t1